MRWYVDMGTNVCPLNAVDVIAYAVDDTDDLDKLIIIKVLLSVFP